MAGQMDMGKLLAGLKKFVMSYLNIKNNSYR